MTKKLFVGIGLAIVAAIVGCASQTEMMAPFVNVSIYRGVDSSNAGRAKLGPGQFAFNADLSTFSSPASAPVQKACNYMFTATPAVAAVGASGAVVGLPGYVATFDDHPQGHWSIAAPPGTAAVDAASAVSTYTQANRGNVVNGTNLACN